MLVSAKLKSLRKSPRKVRLVSSALKGMDVEKAESQLKFLVKGSVPHFEKLLKSAVANAEENFGLDKNNLYIKDIVVNEKTKMKRWLPRAHGRASLLLKRTCSVEIILDERVKGKGRKKVVKQEIKDVKDIEKAEASVDSKTLAGKEEKESEKKEIIKEREGKEFLDEKKKAAESKAVPTGKQGFLKRVFRRKSM
jgi:large subunit ribosomal protein L22